MTHSTPTGPHPDAGEAFDANERLSGDDLATRLEGQALASALAQQGAAAASQRHRPGKCANCQQPCLPLAVYCDDDCRDDHERRVAIRRRQGLAP